jgi:AAA15 family ATPase/GTPase
MRNLTNKDIEKTAVMEIMIYIEELIEKIAIQSTKELNQINQAKKIQGLYPKKRIDRLCIKNAIKYLCDEGHPLNRRKSGGKK